MSLDSLRKLRARTEEAIVMELAQITQELIRLEQQCRILEAQIQSDVTTYHVQAEQGMAVETVMEWHGRMDSQETGLKQARGEVDELTQAWNRTQACLVEATQERKILDHLAERHREAHRAAARRREQLAMDETANRQHSSSGERPA